MSFPGKDELYDKAVNEAEKRVWGEELPKFPSKNEFFRRTVDDADITEAQEWAWNHEYTIIGMSAAVSAAPHLPRKKDVPLVYRRAGAFGTLITTADSLVDGENGYNQLEDSGSFLQNIITSLENKEPVSETVEDKHEGIAYSAAAEIGSLMNETGREELSHHMGYMAEILGRSFPTEEERQRNNLHFAGLCGISTVIVLKDIYDDDEAADIDSYDISGIARDTYNILAVAQNLDDKKDGEFEVNPEVIDDRMQEYINRLSASEYWVSHLPRLQKFYAPTMDFLGNLQAIARNPTSPERFDK